MATHKTKPLSPAFVACQVKPNGEKSITDTIRFRIDADIKSAVVDNVANPSEYYRQLIEADVIARGWYVPE